jgi:hypothetical protein
MRLLALTLFAVLLGATRAQARPLPDVPAPQGLKAPGLHVEWAPRFAAPRKGTLAQLAGTPPYIAGDTPVSTGVWVVHGSFALVPLAGVYGASRLGDERLWVTTAEMAAGTLTGALPGTLLFIHSADSGGRWAELDVAAFGAGLALTPPVAALGTWGLGELAFQGSQDRGRAFLGALGGAAAGTLLGVAVHGLLEEVVGNTDALEWVRKYIALGFIGSGATVGYQWAGGGPRERSR